MIGQRGRGRAWKVGRTSDRKEMLACDERGMRGIRQDGLLEDCLLGETDSEEVRNQQLRATLPRSRCDTLCCSPVRRPSNSPSPRLPNRSNRSLGGGLIIIVEDGNASPPF